MQKIINTNDLAFLLYELLDVERFTRYSRYADHSRDTFDAAIELALKVGAKPSHRTTTCATATSRASRTARWSCVRRCPRRWQYCVIPA